LAIIVAGAQEKRDKGIQVMGTLDKGGKGNPSQDQDAAKGKPSLSRNNPNAVPGAQADTVAFSMDEELHFEDLPAPELPDKIPDF
jgi:hypothetical protein